MEPIRVVRDGTYVPDWGNESRVDGEKITVHYRFLSFAEQQTIMEVEDLDKPFVVETKVVGRMITKVENLSIEDEDGERAIEDGEALINEPALDALALEVWQYLREKTAIAKKK